MIQAKRKFVSEETPKSHRSCPPGRLYSQKTLIMATVSTPSLSLSVGARVELSDCAKPWEGRTLSMKPKPICHNGSIPCHIL